MTDASDGEDEIKLSSHALAALQDFYQEKDVREKRFDELRAAAEESGSEAALSMEMFTEDWNASQFWYSDETATKLAEALLDEATAETAIAVVSVPSVFIKIKNLLASKSYAVAPYVRLLEFDERFAVLKEFVHYDFHSPIKLPPDMKGKFDRIICDPPFLSPDCQIKAAMTVRWLSKPASKEPRVIVCTGERMEELIHKVHSGCRTTTFEPQHAQDRLSNEFRCFANYECNVWSWR